jgi:hypothetical protein
VAANPGALSKRLPTAKTLAYKVLRSARGQRPRRAERRSGAGCSRAEVGREAREPLPEPLPARGSASARRSAPAERAIQ